ncbi:MAG TPA: hypothetical protein VGO33_04580 [Gemmatimonadaceae bacterium]|jgi:hypothetical protein|nr:hypothetical protein [Gemmatimonadaceae bacterium]
MLTIKPFALLLLILGAESALAQIPTQSVQSEVRVDGIFARSTGVEAGFGVSVPSGIYVRTGLVGGVGAGRHGVESRADFITRFSLDPFRQSRWAPYAGAGVSGRFRASADGGARAYLLVFLGIEGPLPERQLAGWVPAVELGLGGGARVGLILRRGIVGRR